MTAATDNRTFDSVNPATGATVGTHPIHDAAAVRRAVEAGQEAAAWWAGLGYAERKARLLAFASVVIRDIRQIARMVCEETGKPEGDAIVETAFTVVHIDWVARNARRVLGPRRVFTGPLALHLAGTVEYQPYGVVGVIGPWNYPVFTPMGSIAYALAAGNAVVFKPSELTPGVGVLLAELFARVVPERPVFQVVTGLGETGAALAADPGIGKIAFIGSTATAKRVMAACAANLTPIVAECGGKDALIVDADADVAAAADAALWGAMSNAGQTCVGVERVYVVDAVYEEFMRELTRRAEALKAGEDYGPITMPAQVGIIRRHIEDAVAHGRPVLGGPASVREPYVDPVIVEGVPEDSPAMREETFGPTVVVNRVAAVEEALTRANATAYGLGGTIFSRNTRRAMELARRLRGGMVSINSVISFTGIPALPFGGVGDSGFGRIHGADGLREFARPKAISRQRFPVPGMNITSFTRRPESIDRLVRLLTFMHGRRR